MLTSRALAAARAAAFRSSIVTPRILASRTLVPRVLAYQSIQRWNHQDGSGSGKKPSSSKFPPFPRPPTDETPSEPSSQSRPTEPSESIETEPQSAPKRPLPDLRQGLPSTFEQEFLKDSKAKEEATGEPDITDADPASHGKQSSSGGSGGRGEIPKAAYESSIDKRRNRFAQIFYVSLLTALISGSIWAGRDWDDEEEAKKHAEDAPSGWGLGLWYNRIYARVKDQLGYYTEPTFPKLLPDKVGQFMEQFPPYTLVLSLEDLLVHEEWNRDDGWKIAKRPGVDFFLMYLARHYELCIFTSIPAMMAEPITKKLDPYHFAPWVLFREATRYDNGDYVKDLSYLNRDLSKVILIDTKPSHAKSQPENSIIIPPWTGDPNDRGLLSLIPLLEYIPMFQVEDVRTVIKSFEGKEIGPEFARREALMRERVQTAAKSKLAPASQKSSGGILGKLAGSLGMKQPAAGTSVLVNPDGTTVSLMEELAQGKTIFDIYREANMKDVKHTQQQIKENGEKWLKEEEEMLKKAEAEEMKKVKSNFFGFLGGGSDSEDKKE